VRILALGDAFSEATQRAALMQLLPQLDSARVQLTAAALRAASGRHHGSAGAERRRLDRSAC